MVAPLGFDVVVLDQEHGVFDRQGIDATLCAARGADIAALVRVPGPDAILSALDCGATGVLVPQVSGPGKAAEVASPCRYRNGSRGFATTTRAGGYGAVPAAQHIATADASVTVVAQIEDREALEQIDAIAAVEGIDCLFIGGTELEHTPFYYRVHSPVMMIEFDHHAGVFLDNAEPERFHAHTIVRTPNGNDYGIDLLRQHYQRFEHTPHGHLPKHGR